MSCAGRQAPSNTLFDDHVPWRFCRCLYLYEGSALTPILPPLNPQAFPEKLPEFLAQIMLITRSKGLSICFGLSGLGVDDERDSRCPSLQKHGCNQPDQKKVEEGAGHEENVDHHRQRCLGAQF